MDEHICDLATFLTVFRQYLSEFSIFSKPVFRAKHPTKILCLLLCSNINLPHQDSSKYDWDCLQVYIKCYRLENNLKLRIQAL